MTPVEWAGFAAVDVVAVGGLVLVVGWCARRVREVVDNWTDDND